MLVVPVSALPAQTFTVQLGGQNVRLNIYQKAFGLFMDVFVNDELIIAGVICLDAVRIVGSTYLGFVGDLAFYDALSADDPYYTGLGSRWFLAYIEASEL